MGGEPFSKILQKSELRRGSVAKLTRIWFVISEAILYFLVIDSAALERYISFSRPSGPLP